VPFAGFDDFDDCLATMQDEEGHDRESAENICGALQAEAKSDHGNVDELRRALANGSGLIADVGVDLVSGVDVPAVDSKWVMTKSEDCDGHDYRADSRLVLAKADDRDDDRDERISYAAAMIPREPDKEGDVVATPTVEQAARDFLKSGGGVDTDHSLIDGEGEVVESWVLKQEREFDLPGGATETYGAGTWMVGIEWGADAWDRIQRGELTGLSIYGMADHVPLARSVEAPTAGGCLEAAEWAQARREVAKDVTVPFADESVVQILYASRNVAAKAARRFGFEGDPEEITHRHEYDGTEHWMPAPSHEEYVSAYNEYAEADGFGPLEDGEIVAASLSKDEEDPCWEGYTMVGTDENGDPNCVPDDEVDDVEFDSAEPRTDVSVVTLKAGDAEAKDMAPDTADGGGDASDGGTDGDPTLAELHAKVDSLQETVASDTSGGEPTEKQDAQEAAAELGEAMDMRPGDIMDVIEAAAGHDASDVIDAIDSIESGPDEMEADAESEAKEEHGDMDDEDEEEKTAEKRASEAHLGKGTDARQTAAKGIDRDTDGGGSLSYQAAAERAETTEDE